MIWTICIATTPLRKKQFSRLLKRLLPQVENRDIEILVFWNNYEYSIGYLRQQMLEEAKGKYISHIDDDDMVPKDFVDTIFPLLDGVDYIGFKVKFIDSGKDMPPVYHSLMFKTWSQDSDGYYRGITHLNPIRTKLARGSSFPVELNIGEDEQWASKVKAKTEHFIDREMYIYNHQGDEPERPRPHDTPIRPLIVNQHVRFHPRSTNEN